jgi:diguanylate cyclase (GGDEF)-like protein
MSPEPSSLSLADVVDLTRTPRAWPVPSRVLGELTDPRAFGAADQPAAADLSAALEAAGQALLLIDGRGVVTMSNTPGRELFDLPAQGRGRVGLAQLVAPSEQRLARAALDRGEAWVTSVPLPGAAGGEQVPIVLQPTGAWSERGLLLVLGHRPVSPLLAVDPLTGLMTREAFVDQVDASLGALEAVGGGGELLVIDIERFRLLVHRLSPEVGAHVLTAFAGRFQRAVPSRALVARIGGDSFAAFCPRPAGGLADVVRRCTAAPFHFEGLEIHLRATAGIATVGGDVWPDASALLSWGEAASAGAPAGSLGEVPLLEGARSSSDLAGQIRRALRNHEFSLAYQPIHSLVRGRVMGAEALLRWTTPSGKRRSPADFLPVAEETGLINEIGRWVFVEACAQVRHWDEDPRTAGLTVNINVSVGELMDGNVADDLAAALNATGVDPCRVEIELTESMHLTDLHRGAAELGALQDLGASVALDDFGTGYSSLQHLRALPANTLKIDRAFVDGIGVHEVDRAIVSSMLDLGRGLDLGVVAEGVETAEQLGALRELGCDLAQGYHLGRPAPGDALRERLARPMTC